MTEHASSTCEGQNRRRRRRAFFGGATLSLFAGVGYLAFMLSGGEGSRWNLIVAPSLILFIPGWIVGTVLSGGIHRANDWMVLVLGTTANCLLYSVLWFLVGRMRGKAD